MSGDSGFFKLGLFIIAGMMLLVGGVVFLGAGEMFTKYVIVESASTDSVEGLDVGAAVKYLGVTVGKVSKIEMAMWKYPSQDPAVMANVRRYIYLEMSLRRDLLPAKSDEELRSNFDAAVKVGLRARMASSGLTGPTFLEICYMDPLQNPVMPVPWQPENLYLPSAPSVMSQIAANLEIILNQVRNADIGKTLADARKLVIDSDTAINNLQTKLLREKAVALIDEAQASVQRIHEILDDPKVKQAIADLPRITAPLRDALARIDTIVHDPKVQKMIDDLSQTAASAAPSAEELRRVLRTLNLTLDSRKRDLEMIITDLRRTLESSSALMEDAKDNPSRLLFGQPPPHIEGTDQK